LCFAYTTDNVGELMFILCSRRGLNEKFHVFCGGKARVEKKPFLVTPMTHQSQVFVFLGFLRYCLEICLDLVGFGWFPLV
jgi:hypothetical protein